MKETLKTVGFKVDGTALKQLSEQARKEQLSPGELARKIVMENLNNEEREIDRLRLKVSAVENELLDLRRDLSVAVQALLAASGRVTPEQAQEWVRLNMKTV